MWKIEDFEVLKQFRNSINGGVHGIYKCKVNGSEEFLVRNENEVGCICFFLDEPIVSCLPRVNDEIVQEVIRLSDIELNKESEE